MYSSKEKKIIVDISDEILTNESEKILFKLGKGSQLTEIMREEQPMHVISIQFWMESVSMSAIIISGEEPEMMFSFGNKNFDINYGATVDEVLQVIECFLLSGDENLESELYEMLIDKMTPHLEIGTFFPKALRIREFLSNLLEDVSPDYNSYMNGYYDGLEKALSILENRPANFYPKPDVWIEDLKGHTPADMRLELELEQRGHRLTLDSQIIPIIYESDYTLDVTKEKD